MEKNKKQIIERTIYVDLETWKEVKKDLIDKGKSFSAWVREQMDVYLKSIKLTRGKNEKV